MEGMEQPLTYWRPSIAPSGMMLYSGENLKNGKIHFSYPLYQARFWQIDSK